MLGLYPPVRAAGMLLLALGAMLVGSSTELGATACCDPDGPFREGEEWAERPASCDNVEYWADRAPITNARISLAIKGRLVAVKKTDVVTYLTMCDKKAMQVICVTYDPEGMSAGDTVSFGGGFNRIGPKQVVLDPCLAIE
jgi:hypothetical protein